jgi:hypothetical protein
MTMTKIHSHSWTPEKLTLASRKELETIRKNAVRLGVGDLIELCDNELNARGPQKVPRTKRTQAEHSETDVVTGYHFVCGGDRGVTLIGDDRFWSGSWVVDEGNIRKSLRYGAYLALHETKADMSYRQGQIVDYRRSPRDMVSKTEDGIEFLVRQTDEPYAWVGAGSGEKGYRWTKVVSAPTSDPC